MVITLLCACFPQSAGQAIGFAASGGGIGSFLFPFIMAAIAQRWGIRTGFATYALLAAAMVLAARGLEARAGPQQPQGLERPGDC
jgi:nitrate/nitrite transporter NarK